MWRTESSDQVLGRKRLTLKLNQCFASVQKPSTVKNKASWSQSTWLIERTTQRIRPSLSLFLSSFSCLYNLFKVFNFICFDLFLLMLKKSKSVLLQQKNNRLFSRNNRLFWVWQHCEEINLISILNFYMLQIKLKKESLVNEPVLKVDYTQKEVTTVIKEYIPNSWKFKSF